MKPLLVLQNLADDGPAYLGRWLREHGLPHEVRNAGEGEAFPPDLGRHSALALLGGEMSANDELPSLRRAEALIVEAIRDGKPVIGHCLGGQLMARALGVRVVASPAPEIGWRRIRFAGGDAARRWFGEAAEATVFQWHYEAFELPEGAEALASSDACPLQAFSIGPHLAMQFHIEVDVDKVARWSLETSARFDAARSDHPRSVADGEAMRSEPVATVEASQRMADRIYRRWVTFAGFDASGLRNHHSG